ncbi:uncharacterized protein N7500_009280 [Penicillium coprophilum]|uniref:uncharacterized protein n=1 Tax=Penicillium coprophilum TaxID=36646 RepID=UPI002394AEAD|nr:uncharacterized protein N7500_009280 [Penicillium coprophilum]KAJ5153841.1 hypothetical protein N7500_009280 [Penicillium coprophilum]
MPEPGLGKADELEVIEAFEATEVLETVEELDLTLALLEPYDVPEPGLGKVDELEVTEAFEIVEEAGVTLDILEGTAVPLPDCGEDLREPCSGMVDALELIEELEVLEELDSTSTLLEDKVDLENPDGMAERIVEEYADDNSRESDSLNADVLVLCLICVD